MKRAILVIVMVMVISAGILPVEKFYLKCKIDFAEKMAEKDVFLKSCFSFCADDQFYYFLSSHFCKVFKVEKSTGKLERTIGSRGQGPMELSYPIRVVVKNNKIYVLDEGYCGIKVFGKDGSQIKEFKLGFHPSNTTFDVNDQEEIFIGRFNSTQKHWITVIDNKGKTRYIVKENRDISRYTKEFYSVLKLDNESNPILLFYMTRVLKKYNRDGKLLWKKPVKNELLDQYPDDAEVVRGKGTLNINGVRVFDLCITPNNNIIVTHNGGGSLYDSNGNLKQLIYNPKNSEFEIYDTIFDNNQLVSVNQFGAVVPIFDFKEVLK